RSDLFIENFKFSDGTVWNYKDIQSHIFTDGDDIIKRFYYGNKDNILTGGKGNDRLEGGQYSDIYIFNRGDEKDTIYDIGGNDTLKFGEGISREDVVFWSEGNNLIFDLGNGDMVTVINHSNTASNSIEKIELNNGYYIDKNSLDVAISEMKLKSFDNGIVLNRENILKNGALKDIISSSWKKDNDFTPPLVLDLNSNNTTSINLNNSYAYFDYDNDGVREKTAWIEKGDALLAVDLNNNGLIDNGSEIFGNYFKLQNGKFAKDGYEALAEFDSNKDGKIDKHDDHFSDLLVWKDSNQNGISEDGELVSLKSLGITEIKLPKNKNKSVLENGNVISNSSTFIQNGKEKTMNDVWFKIDLNEAKSDISNDILYDNDFEDSKIDNTLHVDKIKILSQAGIKEIILRSGYTGISINGTSAITSANNGEMSFENVWYRSDNTDTIYDEESNSYISGSGTVRGLDDAMKDNDTLKNSVDEYKNSLDLAFDDLNSNMDNILKNWALNDDFMSNISSTPPIVLDLNQNGITSTKLENSDAYFDYQNNGRRYKTSWIEKEDSLLGIDINGDGVINNAYELFGTFSKLKNGSYAKDGYEALKEFDTNGDGVIDQNDENFEKLVAWQDKNGDGKSEKDEVKSLKDLGISSISLNISDDIKEENGNKITASSTFIKDDKEYVMRDIWFNVSSKQSIAVSDLSDSDEKKISVVEAFRGAKLTAFQRSNPYEILKALKEYENIKYSTISKIISKELFGKEMPTCHIMYQALNQKLNRIIANESNPNEIALSINLLAASLKRDYNFAIHKVGKNTLSNPIIKKLLEKTGIKFSFNENGEIEGVIGKNYFGTKDSDNFNFSKNSEGVIVNSKSGNDLIIGSSYNDELNGGLGNDIIYAGDGIDVLRGAQGDDLLIGGDKSTIYEYYLGDGHDTIVDEGGRDILAFSYLDIENLSIEKDGNNMKILVENPYKKDKIIGSITIIDGFTSGKIEEYYFKDRAYSFDEMFKTVSANSTYYFNSGDGIVSIDDKGGVDKLIFGKGVNFKNIIVIKKENDLEIALNLPNRNYDELLDKLRIKNFFTQAGRIESFIFDNGVILNHEEILSNLKEIKDDKFIMGDDNDNVLNGTDNANIINGKKGNDILNGGFGDDNYIYEKDSGKDIINDTGGNDKLVFGLGITRKDLISKEVGGDLVIALKEEGVSFDELKNSITIKNWKNKDNKIESVMYDNGIVYNIDTLLNTAPTLLSKSSTYTLKNTDTVTGNIGAGDIDGDTLSYKVISNLNNSTINIDKEGNFIYKTGKTVKDTILVEVSDGALSITKELNFNNLGYVIDTNDNITIEDNKLISNSLEFNADIKDVDFLKDKDNLVIKSPSSSLTLKDYFINDKHQIPVINFKDTSLDINSPLYPTKKWWQINPSIKLDNKGVIISYEDNAVLKASSKDDTIISLNSNADIKSFDKDDFIYAGGKNTIINSGDGNDTLLMLGSNSKAYLEDGNDKAFINSSNSFIDAGNGDDALITKGDNNTLIGSNGNDTYIIGKDANNTIIRDKEYVNLIDGGNDTLIIKDTKKENITFSYNGAFNKDLIINYITNDGVKKTASILNQSNKFSAVETIKLDDESFITNDQINKIIQNLNSYGNDKGMNISFADGFQKNPDIMQLYNV
ncbi:calcium-binding protein, partial [Campylobacter ureolyticus]